MKKFFKELTSKIVSAAVEGSVSEAVDKSLSAAVEKSASRDFYRGVGLGHYGSARENSRMTEPYRQSAWVMSAIRHVANPVSCLPIEFTQDRRGGDVTIENAELTRFWETPAVKPGGVMGRQEFIYASIAWLKLEGECFWILDDTWLSRTARKSPIMMARPDDMTEVLDRRTGELVGWRYRDKSDNLQLLIPEQVIHTRNWNPYNHYRGLGDYESAMVASDADYAAGIFARNLSKNNGDRGPIVTADGNPTDEQIQQITRQLREKSLLARRGETKPIFLAGPNVRVQDPTVQSVDTAFIAQRLENRHEVYIAFGVPASFADVVASYSIGSASDYYRLLDTTCRPVAAQLCDSIEKVSSLLLGQRETIFAEFDFSENSAVQQVMAENFKCATEGVDRGLPWRTASDYFNLNLPCFAGDDKARVRSGMVEVEASSPTAPASGSDLNGDPIDMDDPIESMRSLFTCRDHSVDKSKKNEGFAPADPERVALWEGHVATRAEWVKRFESRFGSLLMEARRETLSNIAVAVGEAAKSSTVEKNRALDLVFDLSSWLARFLDGMSEVQEAAMSRAGVELFDELDIDDPLEAPAAAVQVAIQRRENLLADTGTDIWNGIRSSIADAIDEGETLAQIEERVRTEFNGVSRRRARVIAATETAAAFETGRHLMMREAGVEFKEWLTSQDDNVRDSHRPMDGQVVGIDDNFVLPSGVELLHPAGNGPADEVIGCRCISIAAEDPNSFN